MFKIENHNNPQNSLNIKKVKESKISQYLEGGDSSESDSSIAASNSQKSNEDGTFSNLINSLKKTSLVKRKVSSA